ncbi:PelA/Pel-15E family pectate lyase [Luteimonas cucumeris]|uniref:PelA/Pel-15E family pectate lyase n=2 Tax=Luteimonas cucumeris TaxID=985012 RepID=A0A562LDN8_9GAMM|nr:PelA/Pel-15E family pectate lyase [Luteimonas cucumeris]
MMRLALFALGVVLAMPAAAQDPPSLDGFADGIQHWQNRHGRDYARYPPDQVGRIADNLLLYQRRDGGWIENQDPARILDDVERAAFAGQRDRNGGSFDNRNIYTQVEYLAAAFARSGDARYRDASLRGIDFILAQQLPSCGGWPHTVPATQSYHPHITIADDVTAGVLGTLRRVIMDEVLFGFVGADLREKVSAAVARGDACLLRLQLRRDGVLAGWAGQYDRDSLQPAQGRSFELPALAVQESVGVVRYLMSIPQPPPEVVAAIDGAVVWLHRIALAGQRIETFAATPERFQYHSASTDRRLVRDASAPPLWARFYDLQDDSVVLATREGVRVRDYAQIPRERRTGYEWYGYWPQSLLDRDYPRWKRQQAAGGEG